METKRIILVSYGNRELDALCANNDSQYIISFQSKEVRHLLKKVKEPKIIVLSRSETALAKSLGLLIESAIDTVIATLESIDEVFVLIQPESVVLMKGMLERIKKENRKKKSFPKFRILMEKFNPSIGIHPSYLFTIYYRREALSWECLMVDDECWIPCFKPYPIDSFLPEEHIMNGANEAHSAAERMYLAILCGNISQLSHCDMALSEDLLNMSIERCHHIVADRLIDHIDRLKKSQK